jgi:hypothetical protein
MLPEKSEQRVLFSKGKENLQTNLAKEKKTFKQRRQQCHKRGRNCYCCGKLDHTAWDCEVWPKDALKVK